MESPIQSAIQSSADLLTVQYIPGLTKEANKGSVRLPDIVQGRIQKAVVTTYEVRGYCHSISNMYLYISGRRAVADQTVSSASDCANHLR
jgi:hypothetical protein